jgi:hypothetical protein
MTQDKTMVQNRFIQRNTILILATMKKIINIRQNNCNIID